MDIGEIIFRLQDIFQGPWDRIFIDLDQNH